MYENPAALERAQKERLEICIKYDKVSIPLVSDRMGGSHIDLVYVPAFWGVFFTKFGKGIDGFSSEMKEPNFINWVYLEQIIVKSTQFEQNWVFFYQKWYTDVYVIGRNIGIEKVKFWRFRRHIHLWLWHKYPPGSKQGLQSLICSFDLDDRYFCDSKILNLVSRWRWLSGNLCVVELGGPTNSKVDVCANFMHWCVTFVTLSHRKSICCPNRNFPLLGSFNQVRWTRFEVQFDV